MLLIARGFNTLSFGKLMEVYREGNLENGREFWPAEPPGRQLALAEQDFYDYLRRTFFVAPGTFYAVWEENGQYISALRMEPYQDGFLLSGLETAPQHRRRGYAVKLIEAVLGYMGSCRIYSHVSKRNAASLRTHEACGFRKISDHAVYADGSVLSTSVTLMIKQ